MNAPSCAHAIANVQMLSATNGWADCAGPRGSILHYDGTSWQVVFIDHHGAVSGFNGISMISPDEGWAAGGYCVQVCNSAQTFFPMGAEIFHLQHGQWTTEATFPNVTLLNISITANGDGWAVGQIFPKGNFSVVNAFLAHRHNGHWTMDSSVRLNPASWAAIDATNGWLGAQNTSIGYETGTHTTVQTSGAFYPVIMHYQDGAWTKIPAIPILQAYEVDVVGFAFTSPDDGWAIGDVGIGPSYSPLIMHYHNGAWSIVTK